MSRRLKPIKDLSVLVLAPRKHDRQLWADLLKNCGINHPLSMSEISQATATIGSGQVDVVFVDEAYGPKGIASVLIPARNVEFAGGRGICLVLCSKRATAQDVMNARNLGFASLVILPASTDTVRKHLELAARYIPKSDEELGWSAPKIMAKREQETAPLPDPVDDPEAQSADRTGGNAASGKARPGHDGQQAGQAASKGAAPAADADLARDLDAWGTDLEEDHAEQATAKSNGASARPNGQANGAGNGQQGNGADNRTQSGSSPDGGQKARPKSGPKPSDDDEDALPAIKVSGRSGKSAEEEVVFL
ncbi:hypothetical protein [uncultured Cohaesibacter sp.]|uniref:hypothetical protein n=1 Tax=uncultured Cohaesibacter sp. TaxID=1002546 RepID=UPI0029C85B91|nr:hypothetical protein [uncultured Cohaesibacter sp.]